MCVCVYLDRIEDGLQRGEDLCEESVPHVGEDGELVVTCGDGITGGYHGNTSQRP